MCCEKIVCHAICIGRTPENFTTVSTDNPLASSRTTQVRSRQDRSENTSSVMTEITITRPDDWHIHLRDGAVLNQTVNDVARSFQRAIIMPNLSPPVVNSEQATEYRERILSALAESAPGFEPLMTLYLTDNTQPEEIERAKSSGIVHAVKLYPAGATTNSAAGVTDLAHTYPTLQRMQELGMPLLVHGEVTYPDVDIFDREKRFIDEHLSRIARDFPQLKIVLEHITTADAVAFVQSAPENIAATITAHHLLYNRNHMLVGGIRPHLFCLPVLKRSSHQQALLEAATSGNPKFFLGTDSAPHSLHNKETACGCAGCYTAYAAIELYAEAFDAMNALDRLEGFASHFGADFYGLPRNATTITLRRENWQAPAQLPFGDEQLVPLRAGETIRWQVVAAR